MKSWKWLGETYKDDELSEIVESMEMILDRLGPAELSEIADEIDAKMNHLIGGAISAGLSTEDSGAIRVLRALRRACPPNFLGSKAEEVIQ